MEKHIERAVVKAILQRREGNKSFEKIVADFGQKFSKFNPIKNCFDIEPYFGDGKGLVRATKAVLTDKRVDKNWMRENRTDQGNVKEDFKGVYVFIHNESPFYVGISKGVIGRIIQHVKGTSHTTSTLAYKIGLLRHKVVTGNEFTKSRSELNFESKVEPIKKFLRMQKIAWMPIEDDDELALFEIYCSMKLGTWLNTFSTH